jgi:hypothetical protein
LVNALLALLWLQGGAPEVKASVDRDRITVGDEIVFTIRAVSRSAAPMQVVVPTLNGFTLVGRTERTEVSQLGGPSRTTTLELHLRAIRAGHWPLGPARAAQGNETAVADAVTVQVDDQPGATSVASNPVLRRLLDRAPPPARAGQPAVSLVLSSKTGAVGEQMDVLTAAWFPRELRVRLRRPPTLQPPVIEGVWSYPQPVPSGIAATRNVGGKLYDLFVAHQAIFPLVAGRMVVTPAVLKYSVPLALQFFSQEERYSLTSSAETLTVAATPVTGRPAGYAGAVGQNIRIERGVDPDRARAGEPVSVAFALSGDGNPALWPAPEIRWPAWIRAYPDRTDERLALTAGRLGGSKTFRYTVVPDSAGALALPGASYIYYDVGTRSFRVATLAPDVLPVAVGNEARISRPLPPPLMEPDGPPLDWRIVRGLPVWAWALIVLVPPLGVFVVRRRFRRRRPAAPEPPGTLRGVEAELDGLLRELLPSPDGMGTASLIAALRTAGVEPPIAQRLVEVRERLLALRYGPSGGPLPAALTTEVRDLVQRLGRVHATGRGGRVLVALLLLAVIRPVAAQGPTAEELYSHGAMSAAVERFARRAADEPAVPANWYDLGAAYYRLGSDGRAAAAWLQAARLAPRERPVTRALELVPPPESASAARLWMPPLTWEELGLLALPVWMVGWFVLGFKPRRRELAIGVLLLAVALGGSALWLRRRARRPLAIVVTKTTLQLSPHERAPTIGPLEAGSALLVVRRTPGWVMVDAPSRQLGWVPADAVFLLQES